MTGVKTSLKDSIFVKQQIAWKYLRDSTTTEVLYGGAAGGGKAQPLDSMVCTPFGFKKMRDIKIGDIVAHPSGSFTKVIALHPIEKKEILEFTFTDDAKVECCNEHLWYCWEARNKSKFEKKTGIKGTIRTAADMKERLEKGKQDLIPLSNPIQFTTSSRYPKLIDKIPAYILGVLLGDGCITNSVRFSTVDIQVCEEIRKELDPDYTVNKNKPDFEYSITYNKRNEKGYPINPMIETLKELGLMGKKSENKFIPDSFFNAPLYKRIALVQGLMDSDGFVSEYGKVRYSSSSLEMAKGMQKLLWSLGAKATLRPKKTTHLINYRLFIQSNNNELFFRLKRKLDRLTKFNGGNSKAARRIKNIESVGVKECRCITVSSPDGLYITNDYVVTHNSFLGNLWLFCNCDKYAGSRWLMGRSKLKSLKQTTLATFFEIAQMYNWGDRFIYNAQMGEINFVNGSQIILKDLFSYPSDPNFDSLGSLEITGAFIDECNQISHKAKSIVASRIRYKLKEFGLVPKIFMSCNPSKNWVYSEFYLANKNGTLADYRKFVQALPTDNPHISPHYIENLKKLPNASKERLLFGNWEHDDDPTKLIKYSAMFEAINVMVVPDSGKKYITCDVAALGSDDLVMIVWFGFFIVEVVKMGKSGGKDIEKATEKLQKKYDINIENCIFDADGVGALIGGTGGILAGAKRFNNGSRPLWVKKENFKNLKSFCAYKFADRVNAGGYNFYVLSESEDWDRVVKELEQLKGKNMDDDERTWGIMPKSEMKEILGFSPDYMDALLMREWFEYSPSSNEMPDPETSTYKMF